MTPGDGAAAAPAAAAPRGVWRVLVAVLFGTHAGPWLVPMAPRTVLRIVRALLGPAPAGGFYAFSERDTVFRAWYRKIAADQRAGGRAGYVWDDGLGVPMNPRFYNNLGTYAPYGALGDRAYAALSIVLFLGAVAGTYALAGAPLMGGVLALLLLASPLFVSAQLHLGKPEILWWALLVPLALAALRGEWLLAGAVFTAVALVNFAVAFLAGVTCVFLAALFLPGWEGAGLLAAGMAPGLLKTALRLLPFLRGGLLGALAQEQSAVAGAGRGLAARLLAGLRYPPFLVYAAFYLAALAAVVAGGGLGPAHAALGVLALAVYLAGQSVFYLNDPQSFWMWHLALLAAMGAAAPSWAGVAGVLLLAYVHPRMAAVPLPEPPPAPAGGGSAARLRAEAARATRQLAEFPGISPVGLAEMREPVRRLLGGVPAATRVLAELSATDRQLSGYRVFLLTCDACLPHRGVELVPDEYARAYHARLYREVLARFRAGTPPGELRAAAREVGAGYALAYTPAFAGELQAAGFAPAAVLDPAELPERTVRLLALPPAPLALLRAPEAEGVLSPPAAVERRGNALRWEARAGEEYLVRYAWHPRMRAEQGGRALEVVPEPAAGGAVTFMRVRAPAAGPVVLRFVPGWLA